MANCRPVGLLTYGELKCKPKCQTNFDWKNLVDANYNDTFDKLVNNQLSADYESNDDCDKEDVQRRAKKQMLFSDSFGSYRSDDDNTHSYHQVQKSSRYKLRSRGNKNKGKNHQLSKQPSFGEIVFKKKRPDFDAIEKHQLKTLVVKRDYDFRKAKPKEKMNPEHLKILHHALERYKLDNRFSRCFRNQSRATVDAMQCAVVEELQKCNLTASTINPNSLSLLESLIDSRNKIVPNNDSGDPSSLISNRTVPKVNLVTSCKTSDVDNFNHEKENTAKNGCSIIRQSLLQDVNSQFKQPLSNALLTSSSRSSNVPKSDGSYSRNVIGSSSGVKKKVVSFRETEATISMNEATIPNESLVAGSNLETLNRVTGVLKGDKFTSTPVNEPLTAIRCPLKNIHTSECRKTENKSFNAKASKSTLMTNIPNEALTTNSSQIVAAGTRKVVPEIYRNTMSRNHACLTPCISNISPILLAHTGSVLFNQSSSRCRLDYKSDEISDSSSEILDEADELNYKSSSHISSSNSLEPLFENQSNCSVFNKDGTINDKQALDFILSITNQCRSVTFNDVLPRSSFHNSVKIGEGTFGEVFRMKKTNAFSIIKIVPIKGDTVMEESETKQAAFRAMLPEVVILKEIGELRRIYGLQSFLEVFQISYIQGFYPRAFVKQWKAFKTKYGSENESPDSYKETQQYLLFEMEDGGIDLENAKLNSALEAKSIFLQLSCALALGEITLEFEHRDLHWGNILISKTQLSEIKVRLSNHEVSFNTCGVIAKMIDFSLSRVCKGGDIFYKDLRDEGYFNGEGDYQFDIYRLMRVHNGNKWKPYNPKSNIFWLHYLLQKLCDCKEYTAKEKKHNEALLQLKTLSMTLLNFESAIHFVSTHFGFKIA